MSSLSFISLILLFVLSACSSPQLITIPSTAKNDKTLVKIALLHESINQRTFQEASEAICHAIEKAKSNGASWLITSELAYPYYYYVSHHGTDLIGEDEYQKNILKLRECATRNDISLFLGAPTKEKGHHYNSVVLINKDHAFKVLRNKQQSGAFNRQRYSRSPEVLLDSGNYIPVLTHENINFTINICAEIVQEKIIASNLDSTNPKLILAPSFWFDSNTYAQKSSAESFYSSVIEKGKTIIFINQDGYTTDEKRGETFISSHHGLLYKQKKTQENNLVLIEINSQYDVKNLETIKL